MAPIRDDQPIVAQQVVDAGAGIRLRFGRAVEAVLTVPGYRKAAQRVRDSFAAACGSSTAAGHLEELASCGAHTVAAKRKDHT
ncbi:MAG: hypothetical protein ACRDYA_02480 [Egibacteraceae bacterium]